jgi:hypothetical protein
MIESGTKMVRDQELIEYKFTGHQRGKSKNSAGTFGHAS